jgi:hypothetical protein
MREIKIKKKTRSIAIMVLGNLMKVHSIQPSDWKKVFKST